MSTTAPTDLVSEFLNRWKPSGGGERANAQSFLNELCDLLEVERPEPSQPDDEKNTYVFERNILFTHGDGTTSTGWIDLYKRGCFILETKQGTDQAEEPAESFTLTTLPKRTRRGTARRGTRAWDSAMLAARGQAEQYAKALPLAEGWPPFLVIVDVGHSIELYADFSRSGKTYVAFPDSRTHRIFLDDLAKPEIRERLRLVWTDPLALDPTRRAAKVTRELAGQLAEARQVARRSRQPGPSSSPSF